MTVMQAVKQLNPIQRKWKVLIYISILAQQSGIQSLILQINHC